MEASKRLNANSSTAHALIGEGGNIQHVFEDKDLADEVLEEWRSAPTPIHARIETVDLVHSSLDDLTTEET